jgi:hypothetical protein
MTIRLIAMIAALAGLAVDATAQTAPPTPPVRLRGAIAALDGNIVTIATREGTTEKVKLADNWSVLLVAPIALADVKKDSYVGIATLKGPDGAMYALEVLVFPENMRGAGEGHYPWDLQPQSMMTNANVTAVVAASDATTLTLTYKTGEQVIKVRPDTPVVTFLPGTRELAKPGAKLIVTAMRQPDGTLTAARLAIGKDGMMPPM